MQKNPKITSSEYGTPAWFEEMFATAASGFDRWGHQWRASQQFRYNLTLSLIRARITTTTAQKILDAGCGLGDFLAMLSNISPGHDYYGMDISTAAISGAHLKYPPFTFRQGVLPDITYTGSFDGISALDCICYLGNNDRVAAMQTIHEHLKSGGWFLFSSPLASGPRYFTIQQALEMLVETGFKVERIQFNYSRLYNQLEAAFLTIIRASDKATTFVDKDSIAPTSKARLLKTAVNMPLAGAGIQWTLGTAARLSRKFLQSSGPMAVMDQLSRRLFPRTGRSHILILAVRNG